MRTRLPKRPIDCLDDRFTVDDVSDFVASLGFVVVVVVQGQR